MKLIKSDYRVLDRNDRKLILPMCTAYEVFIECKKEMFDKIIESL